MIDPTGRSAQPPKQKLVRLISLLAGVFVIGCGIGWLFGQIEAPSNDAGAQRVATTLVTPTAPTPSAVAPDTLAQTQPVSAAPANSVAPMPATPGPPAPTPSVVPPIVVEPSPPQPAPAQPIAAAPSIPVAAATPPPEPAAAPVETPVPTHRPRHGHIQKPGYGERHHRKHGREQADSGVVTVIGGKASHPGAGWIVQLGAFRTHDHAALLLMTLQAHGTSATIVKADRGARGIWYVVQTPAESSLDRARAEARVLAAREKLSVSVLRDR